MLTNIMAWVARAAVGKKAIGYIGWLHDKLDGHRSEIALGMYAMAHGLKMLGILPAAQADAIESALLAVLPVVLADKASKVAKIADKIVPAK